MKVERNEGIRYWTNESMRGKRECVQAAYGIFRYYIQYACFSHFQLHVVRQVNVTLLFESIAMVGLDAQAGSTRNERDGNNTGKHEELTEEPLLGRTFDFTEAERERLGANSRGKHRASQFRARPVPRSTRERRLRQEHVERKQRPRQFTRSRWPPSAPDPLPRYQQNLRRGRFSFMERVDRAHATPTNRGEPTSTNRPQPSQQEHASRQRPMARPQSAHSTLHGAERRVKFAPSSGEEGEEEGDSDGYGAGSPHRASIPEAETNVELFESSRSLADHLADEGNLDVALGRANEERFRRYKAQLEEERRRRREEGLPLDSDASSEDGNNADAPESSDASDGENDEEDDEDWSWMDRYRPTGDEYRRFAEPAQRFADEAVQVGECATDTEVEAGKRTAFHDSGGPLSPKSADARVQSDERSDSEGEGTSANESEEGEEHEREVPMAGRKHTGCVHYMGEAE